ncbi:MAG: medium chain dehydrogenase/reductase family protein [Chlamydiota bacterium]
MKRVVVDKPGGYERLQLKSYPMPQPEEGEVLIGCKACGVNFADCCVRMGIYRSAKVYEGWPITPGFEVSGEVLEVGENVNNYQVGDKVIAITRFGGYTSHLVVPECQVFALPKSMSFEEGAAFPGVFLTAYYGLIELTHPRPKSTILVHSAAGGVGSALVQLSKAIGCEVIGVVGSSEKVKFVEELGADAVIDKSTSNLWENAERLAPKGFDVILDANGRETLKEGYQHLAPGGKIVVYGFHTMLSKGRGRPNWLKIVWNYLRTPRFNPLNLTTDNHGVLGFNLSYLFDKVDLFQEFINQMFTWLDEEKIHPPTVTAYNLENVAQAHKDLESGKTVGKLVLLTSC